MVNTEDQLNEERRKNSILQLKIDATTADEDKKMLAELTQAVTDKDKQIEVSWYQVNACP